MKYFALVLSVLMMSLPASAVFEARAHYGANAYDPDVFNSTWSSNLQLSEGTTMGADIVYGLLGGRLPLGVRYEMMEEDFSGAGFTRSLEQTRVSLLAGWRLLLGTWGYIGVLGGYVVSGNLEFSETGTTATSPYESDSVSGFTAGIESTYRFASGFTIGAEVGQAMVEFDETTYGGQAGATYNSKTADFELEGVYYKLRIGLMF